MKKTVFLFGLIFMLGFAAQAQTNDCESGYCPDTLTVHHRAGLVAPVDATIKYKVIESNLASASNNTPSCWLAQNLGASTQASSSTSTDQASRGWFWQFNRKQGYAHDGTTRTPDTEWITLIDEDSGWLAENDPCTIMLGSNWRIPTITEYTNMMTNGAFANVGDGYNSELKFHVSGRLNEGSLADAGIFSSYWSSTSYAQTTGAMYFFTTGECTLYTADSKYYGFSIRCIRDYSW